MEHLWPWTFQVTDQPFICTECLLCVPLAACCSYKNTKVKEVPLCHLWRSPHKLITHYPGLPFSAGPSPRPHLQGVGRNPQDREVTGIPTAGVWLADQPLLLWKRQGWENGVESVPTATYLLNGLWEASALPGQQSVM